MEIGWVVGIAGSVVTLVWAGITLTRHYRKRLLAQVRRRREPRELELFTIGFHVWLERSIPEIEIRFRAVNYTKKPLTSVHVSVRTIAADNLLQLQQIESGNQGEIPPMESREVRCRRSLSDAEVRTFDGVPRGRYMEGSLMVVARAFKGRKEVQFEPFRARIITGTSVM